MKTRTTKRLHKLTGKQKAFADAILANPKRPAYVAAGEAYETVDTDTQMSIASENLRKPQIMAYLSDRAQEAEIVLFDTMQRSNELIETAPGYATAAIAAANSVLDRVHGKATQRIESTSTRLTISIDLTQEDVDVVEADLA